MNGSLYFVMNEKLVVNNIYTRNMSTHYLKLLIILLCAILHLQPANAGKLTSAEAMDAAVNFFGGRDCRRLSARSSLTLAQTKTDSRGEPVYYVFNAVDGKGFIIISADEPGMRVIGYSYENVYSVGDVPANVSLVLDNKVEASGRVSGRKVSGRVLRRKELSTAKWSQEAPFNNLIPGRRLTGCVGTAMAIIMKYHNWPERGNGSLGETDFNVEYDWDNMRVDNYKYGYSATEGDAVALLMSHAAQSIMTEFGMSGSSAFEVRVPAALINYFGYDAGVSYKKGAEMERRAWDNLVMSEIDADRPVLYCGQDVTIGHAFVCDGYENDGNNTYFHINWGWAGLADGYFASDNLSPQASRNYSFNSLTSIVYNIKPATVSTKWSPVHLTNDGNQVGMTIDVENLVPGETFALRAGALKNVSHSDFSGKLAVALYDAGNVMKGILSTPRNLSLVSLQSVDYVDINCTVPTEMSVSDGDVVRLVADSGDGEYLPVASELTVIGSVAAKNNKIPYFEINIPSGVDGVEVTAGDSKVIKGRDFEFKVSPLSPDKVVTVKANGFILTPDNSNVYRLKNVNKSQDIDIIVQNAADVVSKRSLWVEAGSLSTLISDTEAATVTDLTLYGSIDVNDFTFMRERMRLERLDLSGVNIIANGINPANAIPAKAFKGCGSLHVIILPSNLTTFKSGCFNASGIRSIEIPASVSTYEYNIFLNCGNLKEIIVRRPTPAWVNWCVFAGTPKARLIVPVGAAAAYQKAENWNEFKEIVEENPIPVTSCTVTFQDIEGVRFNAITEGSEVTPGTSYMFTLDTNDSMGDAMVEVYANNILLHPEEGGIYKTVISKNTIIYTNIIQPQPALGNSPWKITGAAGGIGLVTDAINVVPGKMFTIRANALAIPSGSDASMFYAAALTDGKGNIKELISPVMTNSNTNFGDLPCSFNCQVKEASVREGNSIMVVTSYNKKNWRLVRAADDSVIDNIPAIGNKVIYHTVTMPENVQGAVIQGAVSQIVRGMPLNIKVLPVSVDDVVTIAVNGINKIVDQPVANLSISAVTEDIDIAIQVNPAGSGAYTVVNVREGELAAKIESCPARLKVTGVMLSSDFDAFRNHAATITDLDLADVEIKGNGDLANAIPSNAFAALSPTIRTMLKSIILPSTLERVEASAFTRCIALNEIILPASVSYIGSGAFSSCVSLKKIVALGSVPARLGMSPFPNNTSGITLEVPSGAEDAYRNAEYWKELNIKTSVVYYNIQIDPTRTFNYNPAAFTLTKIPHPDREKSVTLGLPNCKGKDNEVIRPGVAYKLYDNNKDVTYTSSFVKYGQHGVTFDPGYTDPLVSLKCPQNHVIDVVFHYGITFNVPEGYEASFVNLSPENEWRKVEMWMFDENSVESPTLYREGVDYAFALSSKSSGIDTKVRMISRVMIKTGASPEYKETEELLLPDENGVYVISDLQGDTRIDVTIVPQDGAVISPEELVSIDDDDVKDITAIGISGEMSEEDFEVFREKFSSLESVDLSGVTNESIPDNAFAGMSELRSVTLPACVASIGKNAFSGCSGLSSVTLSGVTSIGEGAFEGCDNLTGITINASVAESENPVVRTRYNNEGIGVESFRGVNPNCLIHVSDLALASSLTDVRNVIYSGDGDRVAVSDISLISGYPFCAPGSFRLGDRKIDCSVSVMRGDKGGWTGITLPFAPDEMAVDGKPCTFAGEVSLYSFSDKNSERLSRQSAMNVNVPYIIRVDGDLERSAEIVFTAKGTHDGEAYDVPLTPSEGEIVAAGRDFTLYGGYDTRTVADGDYILDEAGEAFRLVDMADDADTPVKAPFSVYVRANNASASDALYIDDKVSGVIDLAVVEVDGMLLSREGSMLIIESEECRVVDVYNISGCKVVSVSLSQGRNVISLSPGIYVIDGRKILM